MHLGTFTSGGTWEAASRELPELAKVGITVIEIMPIADFPGRFGWGYDGVNLFARTSMARLTIVDVSSIARTHWGSG